MMEGLGFMFCLEEFSELQVLLKLYGPHILCGKTELFYSINVMVGLGTSRTGYLMYSLCDLAKVL